MPHGHPKALGLRITKIVVPLCFTTASKEKEAGHLARPLVCVLFLVNSTKLLSDGSAVLLRLVGRDRRRAGQARVLPRTIH